MVPVTKPRSSCDPKEMAARGRIGAYTSHSRHDLHDLTASARAAFLQTFEDQVDPDGVLPAGERARRVEAARKAHFARLAYRSAAARRAHKASEAEGGEAA